MNTKGIKFLAVLAVFAMAFAVVATVNDSQSDAAANIIGVYDENGQLITETGLTVSSNKTWYVDAEASITGAAISVTEGTLTIVLKDSETPSVFTIYGATIAGNMVLSKDITMILPSTGTSIAVTGALTVNGTVQNDRANTAFTLSGASAKIDGTGTIQGTVAPMLSIVSGMVTGVTFSAAKWDPTETYAGFEMVEVASSNDDNVTIDGVSFEMVAGTAAGDEYAHGICVDAIAADKTVLIKNVTFASAKSENVKTQYLIGATNVSGILKMEKINCDSVVFADDGAMFNAMGLTKIGENVTWDDTLKSVKLSTACTITKSVTIDNLVLRTKGGSLSVEESQTLTVNGGITYAGTDQVTITLGTNSKIVNSGTTRMDGNIKITGGDVVNNGTLVMDNKATIENLTNTKTVRLYDGVIGTAETTAAGTLVNNGTIYVMDEDAVINVADKSGTGTIDTSAISEEVFIHGDISTSGTEFKWNQKVTFDGDTTLLKGASLTFYGKVIIPAGVTVTIEDGAAITINGDKAKALGQLNIDGTLIIEGFIPAPSNDTAPVAGLTIVKGEVVNNGTIELAYDGSEAKAELVNIEAGTTFANNGIITIGEKSKLNNAAKSFVNSADGVITIYGDLTGTTADNAAIQNSGLIAISSEVNTAICISNAAVSAKIDILMTAANVTIDDKKIEPIDGKLVPGENQIALTVKTGTTCGGITVTGALYPVLDATKIVSHTALVIDGALIVSKETGEVTAADNATLALTSTAGRIVVADELTLTNTKLTTATNTELYVSGELTLTKDCGFQNDGVLTVPGIVYMVGCSIDPEHTGTINAAMYKIPQTVLTSQVIVYTNVPDAIAGAEEASVKTVTVTGTVTIAESIVIPAGMTMKTETGSKVTIAKDVVVEVYSDGIEFAVLNNGGTITVNGKLIYDDAKKSQKGTEPISEVVLKSDNTVVYTTLAWAIADAGSEEATIELCGPTTITKDMTIPENITVDTNGKDFTVDGAVLTIDGVLYLDGATVYTVKGTDPKIVVNGAITSEKEMPFDGKKFPAGLYFSVGDKKLNYIGNIDDAEAWALLADEGKLTYEGDLKTIGISFDADATLDFNGDVTAVSMTVGSKAIVNFKKNVEIATVTMGEATIGFAQGKTIDGIFTSPVGTIAFDEALVNATSSLKVAVKSTVTTMTLSGDVGKAETEDDYEYQVSTLGDVVITAKLADLYVGTGTTTIGKSTSIDYILVDGDLVIDNDFKLTAKDGYVYGSITANDATDTKKKATVEFTGYLYVGIDFDEDAIVAAAATVAGDVTAKYAFVSADATVSATITDMLYSTDVYVEGVEELTIYSNDSKFDFEDELEEIDFVISDPSAAYTGKWVDEDGKDVESFVIGAYDAIYEVFNYNIYDIEIITDAGIKSVAINGIELKNALGNIFTIDDLTAGTYKVTYTLKNGYSGEAVLSTSTGTILKDNSFVISPGSETDLSFQLAGTEPTPEPEPVTPEEKSEWTVTTILLVILVILIAIMAVIVALRLNRS